MHPDPARAYLRWALLRAAAWRGYWTVLAVSLVVDDRLSPAQLVLIGSLQSLTVLVAEIPAGVVADSVGRRRAVAVAQLVTGGGMVVAGMVHGFALLAASQCLCGVGWAFASGADVAWLSDELGDRTIVDQALTARARLELVGALLGMAAFGVLAAATSSASAVVTAGGAMVILASSVARWPERGFEPADPGERSRRAALVLADGVRLARTDRVILGALVATALFNGGAQVYGRLLQEHLLSLG